MVADRTGKKKDQDKDMPIPDNIIKRLKVYKYLLDNGLNLEDIKYLLSNDMASIEG